MKNRHSRNGGREKHSRLAILAMSLSVIVLMVMTFCVVDYSGGDADISQSRVRATNCERTCTSRIHKAAVETANSFSSSHPNKSSSTPSNTDRSSPLALNRPKRLPTLISILTGFHENYAHTQPVNYHNISRKGSNIIARRHKPQFPKPMNTIQQVATSAAHAVWKERYSYRIDRVGGMSSVNKEWEEALRWIASWDEASLLQQQQEQQQQQQGVEMPSLQNLSRMDELWKHVYSSVLDDKREDFTAFVNDLAGLLQTCIDTCLKDEAFDIWIDQEIGDDESDVGVSLVGNLVTQSFFSWVFRDTLSLPFRIPHQEEGLVHSTMRFVVSGAVRLLAASVTVYFVHCLWIGSPILTQLYESSTGISRLYTSFVGRDENSPAWLIEHERELELAKKSRQKKKSSKKPKRRGVTKKQSNVSEKESTSTVEWRSPDPPFSKSTESNEAVSEVPTRHVRDDDSNDRWERYYRRPQQVPNKDSNAVPSSSGLRIKTDIDMADDNLGGVPSSISFSTSSCTTSNNDHSDDRNMSSSATSDGSTSPSLSNLNHQPNPQQRITNTPPRKPLLVPTERQRNEAAQRLRDFQNAQIQRLLKQKQHAKLSQSLNINSNNDAKLTPILSNSTLSSSALNAPAAKVVLPPPGFATGTHINQNIQEDHFFAQNELLLSKLLDDDDNIDDILSVDSGIASFPLESALDPSAAPFVLEGFDTKDNLTSSQPKRNGCESKWGVNDSTNAHVKVKGVYGGSVW